MDAKAKLAQLQALRQQVAQYQQAPGSVYNPQQHMQGMDQEVQRLQQLPPEVESKAEDAKKGEEKDKARRMFPTMRS